MFDYTNNFPLPELRPEARLLRFQAYTQAPEFQAVWQGRGQILDKSRLADPTAWGRETEERESITREELFAAQQLLSAESGGNTGLYGEIIHSSLGQDVNQGAVLRSIYFGADPLNAMQFAPSELPQTKEEEDYLADTLNKLLASEVGKPVNQKNLTPQQKRIKEIGDKLAYKKAMDRADQKLGLSLSRQILAQSSWVSSLADWVGWADKDETGKLARNLDDIIRVRTRVDPNYSPSEWFEEKFSDPTVQQGLLDNGITADFIADTTNSDEAEYRIYKALNQTDMQRRMATYVPQWGDTPRMLGANLVAGFINSPDIVIDAGEVVAGAALTIGGAAIAPFTGGTSLVGTAIGATTTATGTANLFLKLKNIWQASKALRGTYYAAETALKLPIGFAPSYAKNLGLLGRVAVPTLMGASGGAITEYSRQQNQMAYAAATLYADPDAVKDYNMGEVAMAGLQGGLLGGTMFGLAPNVISSLYGASKNKLLGVNYAKLGEPVLRDTSDRRFSLKGTVIGEAIDSLGNIKIKREKSVAVDGPLQETMAAKAEIENKKPTAEEIVARTEERVDRVETKNVESAEQAQTIPQTPALKRYENETRAGYVERVAGLKVVDNVFQFARELGRRSVAASDNLKLTTDNWDQMTTEDRLKVLIDMEKQIKSLVSFEAKTEGGVTTERAKAISKMEVQRKALIKHLKKGLTKDQIKVFNKENKGGVALDAPTALQAVRAAVDAPKKREAASELAAALISKAQQIAKQPEKAAEIRSEIPQDLLDSFDEIQTEVQLKGSVSEETVEVIKANVAGIAPPQPGAVDKFRDAIKRALLVKKIDEARMEKIRMLINNPDNFVNIVSGNKTNAQRFYSFVKRMRHSDMISKEDMELVLTAVVHLNFDNKAFDLNYNITTIIDPETGKPLTGVVGRFKVNSITMNSAWRGKGEQFSKIRAMTIIHELGHAFFHHKAKGDVYLGVLDLYKNSNTHKFFLSDIRDADDKLLANSFLDAYHYTNAEETFVETFSKILFTEAEFAVSSLNPIQVSMMQSILNRMTESVALAANMWSSSQHYGAARKIMDELLNLDTKFDDGVSVPKYVKALKNALDTTINVDRANETLVNILRSDRYKLTTDEWDILSKMVSRDPAFLVAFTINKTEGRSLKTQDDFNNVINAYNSYKETQFMSVLFKVSWGLSINAKALQEMTKEQRIAFFETNFFDGANRQMGVGALSNAARPPTYEDVILGDIIVAPLQETYDSVYWLTNGNYLRGLMLDRGLDVTIFNESKNLQMSVMETLTDYLNSSGLNDLASVAITAVQRNFLKRLQQQGIFNVADTFNTKPPIWSTAQTAKDSLSDLLTQKTNTTLVLSVLSSQLEPNLFKSLIEMADKVGTTPEKAVEELIKAFYNGVDKGLLSFNEKSGKWQSGKPKITNKAKVPSKPKAEAKTPDQTKLEAAASNSSEITLDNYRDHLVSIAEELNATRDKNGFTSRSIDQALLVVANLTLGKGKTIIAAIESGQINTLEKLKSAIVSGGKNIIKDEGRQVRRIKEIDPETGKPVVTKKIVESSISEAGKTKEGVVAGKMERIDEEGLEKENKTVLVDTLRGLVTSIIPDFFTKEEDDLLNALKTGGYTNKGAATILKKSEATISRQYNKLLARLATVMKDADITFEDISNPVIVREQLTLWNKKQSSTVSETTKGKPSRKKILDTKKEITKPSEISEATGARILELAAKQEKLKTQDPDPVNIPKTTTEVVMTRTTNQVTGNTPEIVIRPQAQADALASGGVPTTTEAVVFTPKKPLQVMFENSTQLEAAPEKLKQLISLGQRLGFDAIVFKDGSMIPMPTAEVKVVGKTETTAPTGIETVVTVTKEKGVPVKKIVPKPDKPKGIGDGTPVTLTKGGRPKDKAPELRQSDIADETPSGRIERIMNEDREALRNSGLDTNSLKEFLSVYWNKMNEFDKGEGQPYTQMFKTLWAKFVVLNDEIHRANLNLFGEEGIKKFWQKVDEIRANEAAKMATVPGYKRRTEAAIFADAAKQVSENFIPYVTPKQLEIKRVGDKTYFNSKDKKIQAILRKEKEEPDIPTPPEPPARPEGTPAPASIPEPDADTPDMSDRMGILEERVNNSESAASMPLRQSNLIGAVFGGSNRESANWWRQLMNWSRNTFGQGPSRAGRTVGSLQRKVRFVTRFFDDRKAQTGHLAAAGKPAFRTAMQCANDESMLIGRVAKYQSLLNANLRNFGEARRALMETIWKKLSKGEDIVEADVSGLGLPSSMVATVTRQANDLLTVVRQVNKVVLDLEAETGLVKTTDELGNPIDPQKWATVQLDHERLSKLTPEQRTQLIVKLVEARTNRKLSNENLDINTIIVMGWLDVRPSAKHEGTALLAGDRRFKPGSTTNTFSRETLANLDTGIVHSIDTDPDGILAGLANKGQPDKFFILEDSGVLRVYRLPEKISDLSEADKLKYFRAINGDTSMYTSRWRTYLRNRNLIEYEMESMLDFKTKRGYYSEYNSKTSSNIDRPLMRIGTPETTALAVPGLIPDEVLAFPEIVSIMRTNLAESYMYFLKGRVFGLLFQRELDRLLGTKGINIIHVFEWLYKTGSDDIKELGKELNWSPAVIEQRIYDLKEGISRLREEYAINADTLPYIPNKEMYSARASMAIMKMKVSPGYIFSALPELVLEVLKQLKQNPIRIPSMIVKLLREVALDLRFSKSAQMREDGATLAYHLENFRHEHGSRFLGEMAHGSFELDNKLRTKFIDSTSPVGMVDRSVRGLEVGARVAESIGSLQAMTNFVRGLGLHRLQTRVWTHFKKGRIQKLMEAMERPEMKELMTRLLIASELSPSEERKLWKQFAAEARKAGFGFEPQEAINFFRFNLNSKEKMRHLEYLIRKVGDSSGRFNMDRMVDAYWEIRRNPVDGYDTKVFEEVLSAYAYMLNTMTVKSTSPESVGLARITNLDAQTPLGKLYYALTSWIRGYQDSVILDYASESTLTYVTKNLLLFGIVDSIIGLFREWLNGREQEDILNEMEENPESFAIRVIKAAPILGTANGLLELVLSGINAYSGGSWRYYGSPMSSIGINAATAATKDITTGIGELAGEASTFAETGEFNGAKVTAATGKIIPFNSLFNRSMVALPARFIEDMDYLDQKGAVQQYLDLIQRDPYPYAKSKKKTGATATARNVVTIPPTPRNIPKERVEYQQQKAARIQPSQALMTNQKGVSSVLGELLE